MNVYSDNELLKYQMKQAGIDIGSRTIKLAILEDGQLIYSVKRESSFDIIGHCREMIEGVRYDTITATGYGRHLFAEHFGADAISEITAFARGTHHLFPTCRTILDIGGQDTKAISIDEQGKVRRFEMNDKCAAGTGRFLEIMAMALKFPLKEFGEAVFMEAEARKINSMCTVFAESEVVSLLAKGANRVELAKGIMQSVINRSINQLQKVGVEDDVIFVGGVALNRGMVHLLEQRLQKRILIATDPQIIGAIGAAIGK